MDRGHQETASEKWLTPGGGSSNLRRTKFHGGGGTSSWLAKISNIIAVRRALATEDDGEVLEANFPIPNQIECGRGGGESSSQSCPSTYKTADPPRLRVLTLRCNLR
jgi:hypothetical protein